MAEHFMFFDSIDPINPDRTYNAEEFTNYFKIIIETGIMQGEKNELKVTTDGSSMITTVNTGFAFVEGKYYENDSPLELTHDTETLGLNRIDRVVLRRDLNTESRYVRAFIKKGTASSNPSPPALTRNNQIYEISLAQVRIVGGQTYITEIIDERGTEDICPWATSKIIPDTTDALREHEENNIVHSIDANDTQMTYSNGRLSIVKEYKDGELAKRTDLSYTGEQLTSVRERFYRDNQLVDDFTYAFSYTSGTLNSVTRSGA